MRVLFNIIFALFFLYSCTVFTKSRQSGFISPRNDDISFNNYFSEGSKRLIFNDLSNAEKYFKACLKIRKSAAVYYQLSNVYVKLNNLNGAKSFAKLSVENDSLNIWYLHHLSSIYRYENKLDSCVIYYEKLCKLDDSYSNLYNLSFLYRSLKRNEDAVKVLSAIEEKLGRVDKDIVLLKHTIYKDFSRDSAVLELNRLIDDNPLDISSYGILAGYLNEVNRVDAADSVFQYMLHLDSLNSLTNLSYGEFLLDNGRVDEAYYYYGVAFTNPALSIDTKMSLLIDFVGNEFIYKRDSIHLFKLIDKLKLNQQDYRIYTLVGNLAINNGNLKEASIQFDSALILTRDNPILWEQSLLVDNYLKRDSTVIIKADSALSRFPQIAKFYFIKSLSLFSNKLYTEVISTSKKGLIVATDTSDIIDLHNLLADAFREIDEDLLADQHYDTILIYEPYNLIVRNNYAYYLSIRGSRLDFAENLSKYTITKDPKNATFLDTYGWILFVKGDYEGARVFLELAIRNGGNKSSEVFDHYGDVMIKLNRCSEAIEAFQSAISVDSLLSEKMNNKIEFVIKNCIEKK